MDYKNTLNLPTTDFPMKADLPKKEPDFLKRWQEMDIYGLIRKQGAGCNPYVLHDGPPYANGNIHLGHALNKVLKDIVVKFKTMQGFDAAYIPGWDCHGLPIEHQLLKELKISKHQIGQVEFRKKAHEYALKYVGIQRDQFERLGVFGDWDHPYLTLQPEYEEAIVKGLAKLFDDGYIYRGLKPVNWCYKCETALAEAEVEYEDHSSPSIFVKFALEKETDTSLVIWTTTPWTLMANVAVAVHPDYTYVFVKTEKGTLVIVKDLLSKALEAMGLAQGQLVKECPGKELEGLVYAHPFGLRKGRVVLASYVSREDGTGLVHTAPGHGNEDYLTGVKYNLDIIMPVDTRGAFDATAGELKGMHVFDANKVILEKLTALGALLYSGKLQHSYPHCWRCKNPIIFRATNQWFLNIDAHGLRSRLLDAINKDVSWVPSAGKERIRAMVESRPHWCLSRQRYWGVPIPSLTCTQCGHEFLLPSVFKAFAQYVSKEGTDCWFARPLEDFTAGQTLTCEKCKGTSFKKGTDILDVWFDSGASSLAVLQKRQGVRFPASLYLEGSDQHRGWFQSSLIVAMATESHPPFERVLTHGFVVDGDGRKMSKSVGNVISPLDLMKNYGADIIRLWVASSDYNEDIRISTQILSRLSEAYRKIRNTIRFILSNLYDFDPEKDAVEYSQWKKIDQWIVWRLERMVGEVTGAYEKFEFHTAYKGVYEFCNQDLSMYYLDMVKGRLYTDKADSPERRAAQSALFATINTLVRLIAPLLAFTAEETFGAMPKGEKEKTVKSVHLLAWPQENPVYAQKGSAANIDEELKTVIALIPDVTKVLEQKRVAGEIGSSFDAKINILTKNEIRYKYLRDLESQMPEIFKVSGVSIKKIAQFDSSLTACSAQPDIAVEALKADGQKCQRCWNFKTAVSADTDGAVLCEKCAKIVKG